MIKSTSGAVAGPSKLRTLHTCTLARTTRPSCRISSGARSLACVSTSCQTRKPRSAWPFVGTLTPALISGKGKQKATEPFEFPTALCSCGREQRRYQQTFVRTISPSGGQARIQLNSTRNGVFGLSTSRGTRAYQEDTASVSCLHLPVDELQRDYLKHHAHANSAAGAAAANAALEWDPDKAGGAQLAGQVVWFGCFDGHGGQQVSSFLRDHLHKTFESVEPDMVTDTVQYTRELGGYFRRFTGGVLQRWVSKDQLKPVRARPAPGRRLPRDVATDNAKAEHTTLVDPTKQVDHISKPGSPLSDIVSDQGKQDTGAQPKGSCDRDWDALIKRIAPPDGMEKETMSMAERLTLAWLVADRQIQSCSAIDVGGSTASVLLLHSLDMPSSPWYSSEFVGMHVAHVGDTRVLLCAAKDGKAIPLTTYHHPDDRGESERLRKMGGGMITDSFGEARWMGALANTRAFGDSRFKKVGITAEPEVYSQVIRGSEYGFVIAFSDGIGGVISDQEVIDLCRNAKHPSEAAQSVMRFAEELGAQDNCTVMVIPLKAWGNVGGEDVTRERREMRRSKVDLYRDNRQ